MALLHQIPILRILQRTLKLVNGQLYVDVAQALSVNDKP